MRRLLFLPLLLLAACGADDGDAVEKCHTFVQTFCARGASCNGFTGDQATTFLTTCEQSAFTTFSCEKAVKVEPSYGQCLNELNTFSCTVLFPKGGTPSLPASCKGVIGVSSK